MTIMPFPAESSSQPSSSRPQAEADALPFSGRFVRKDQIDEVTSLEDLAHGSFLSHNTSFFSVPLLTSFTAVEADDGDEEDEWTEEEVLSDEEGSDVDDDEETCYEEISLYEEVLVTDDEGDSDEDQEGDGNADQEGDEVDFSQSIATMTIQTLLGPVSSAKFEPVNDVTFTQHAEQLLFLQKTTRVSHDEDESTEMDLTESERTEVTNEDLHPLIQTGQTVEFTMNNQESSQVNEEEQEDSVHHAECARVDETRARHIAKEESLPEQKDQKEEELQTEEHRKLAQKKEASRAKQKSEPLVAPIKEPEKSQNNATCPAIEPHSIRPLEKVRPQRTRVRQIKAEGNMTVSSERVETLQIEEKTKKCQSIDTAFHVENLDPDRVQKKKELKKGERQGKERKERPAPVAAGDQKSGKTDQPNKCQAVGGAIHVVTDPITTIPMELPYHTITKTSRSGERDRVRYRTSSRRSAAFKPGL